MNRKVYELAHQIEDIPTDALRHVVTALRLYDRAAACTQCGLCFYLSNFMEFNGVVDKEDAYSYTLIETTQRVLGLPRNFGPSGFNAGRKAVAVLLAGVYEEIVTQRMVAAEVRAGFDKALTPREPQAPIEPDNPDGQASKVLSLLRGGHTSIDRMAEIIGCSATSVSARIRELRNDYHWVIRGVRMPGTSRYRYCLEVA